MVYCWQESHAAMQLRREQIFQRITAQIQEGEDPWAGMSPGDQVVETIELAACQQSLQMLANQLQHRIDLGSNPGGRLGQICRSDERIAAFAKGVYGLSIWRSCTFSGDTVADKVVELLHRVGGPLHYQDIYLLLAREQLVEAGGKKPANSLLPRFSQDHRVQKLGHGMYGLAAWNRAAA